MMFVGMGDNHAEVYLLLMVIGLLRRPVILRNMGSTLELECGCNSAELETFHLVLRRTQGTAERQLDHLTRSYAEDDAARSAVCQEKIGAHD